MARDEILVGILNDAPSYKAVITLLSLHVAALKKVLSCTNWTNGMFYIIITH